METGRASEINLGGVVGNHNASMSDATLRADKSAHAQLTLPASRAEIGTNLSKNSSSILLDMEGASESGPPRSPASFFNVRNLAPQP